MSKNLDEQILQEIWMFILKCISKNQFLTHSYTIIIIISNWKYEVD